MYAQARYYLPKVGRFAEEDSNKGNGYLPESLNYYAYCYNNPVNFIDLDGRRPIVLKAYFDRVGGTIEAKKYTDKDTSIAVVEYNEKKAVFYATNRGMNSANSREKTEDVLFWWPWEKELVYEGTILEDGSMVVDSKDIAEAFGLNESDVVHKPGDKFNSTDKAMQMFKTYYKNSSDFNNPELQGSALYGIKENDSNTPSKFSFCKAVNYKSLLNIYTVGNNLNQPIIHYMLVGCTDGYLDDIQNRYIYHEGRYLHFIDENKDEMIKKDMTLEKAADIMNKYVEGIILEDSVDFKRALDWWKFNGEFKEVKSYVNSSKKYGYNYDVYDKSIIAFSNYWNYIIEKDRQNGVSGCKKYPNFKIILDVVKAFGAVESNLGNNNYTDTRNATRDIMQCLDPRNPTIKVLSGQENEGKAQGLKQGGYGAVKNLYSGSDFNKKSVTPNLSICFGIRWLAYKSLTDKGAGNIYNGVMLYNGGGDENYLIKTKACMKDDVKFFEKRDKIDELKKIIE